MTSKACETGIRQKLLKEMGTAEESLKLKAVATVKLVKGMSGAQWEGRLHRGFGVRARPSRERRLGWRRGRNTGLRGRNSSSCVLEDE